MPWTITDQPGASLSGKPLIATPLPPFGVNSVNMPLRLALAEMVVKLIQGDIGADQWQLVTSLVPRDRLAQEFSAVSPRLQTIATEEGNFGSNPSPAQSGCSWQLDAPVWKKHQFEKPGVACKV